MCYNIEECFNYICTCMLLYTDSRIHVYRHTNTQTRALRNQTIHIPFLFLEQQMWPYAWLDTFLSSLLTSSKIHLSYVCITLKDDLNTWCASKTKSCSAGAAYIAYLFIRTICSYISMPSRTRSSADGYWPYIDMNTYWLCFLQIFSISQADDLSRNPLRFIERFHRMSIHGSLNKTVAIL